MQVYKGLAKRFRKQPDLSEFSRIFSPNNQSTINQSISHHKLNISKLVCADSPKGKPIQIMSKEKKTKQSLAEFEKIIPDDKSDVKI